MNEYSRALNSVRIAIGASQSALRSGEPLSEQLQESITEGLAALDLLSNWPAQSESPAPLTGDELMSRLMELQDFLGVAPDDEGDFGRWAEAVEECLSRIYGPEASLPPASDTLRGAIMTERDTRQWGNQQWKDMFGDFWPQKSAEIRRAADDAIDRLLASYALEKYPKGCTDE